MMTDKKGICATVTRESDKVVISIAEQDRIEAGIAGLICNLNTEVASSPTSVSPASPPRSEPNLLATFESEEDLQAEVEHLEEVCRAKREYIRQLEKDEASEGSSWPPARRLELRRCRKELNDLKVKKQELARLSTDDELPYAVA